MSTPTPPSPPGLHREIFTEPGGRPFEFYIDATDANKSKYTEIIHANGGIVHHDQAALMSPNVIHLSSLPWANKSTVLLQYVDDAIKNRSAPFIPTFQRLPRENRGKKRQTFDPYGDNSVDALGETSNALTTKKKPRELKKRSFKFSPEADLYILEQVRMKPRYRTSHKFFEELSSHEPLRNHTGNSIRSRYRLQLENKLEFVWKTDEFSNLVLDEHGQRIAITVESAKTIKTKFTALDDYNLCKDIIDHVKRNQTPDRLVSGMNDDPTKVDSSNFPLDENKFSVSILFFDQYAHEHPHHSSSSWRDRYRKFARLFGLQKYIMKYELEKDSKTGPTPMRNMTSRLTEEQKFQRKKDRELSKGNKQENSFAHSLGSLTGHPHANAQHQIHDHPHGDPMYVHDQMHAIDSLSGQLDASSVAAVANLAVASRDNNALNSLADKADINANINSNIHEALRGVGAEAGRVNIEEDVVGAIHPTLAVDNHRHRGMHDDHAFNELGLKDSDSQDPLNEMEYMSRDSNTSDLFQDRFFHHDPKSVMNRVLSFLVELGPADAEKVTDTLESFGFTRKFIAHIFRLTGAHALYINEYLNHVFRFLESEKETDVANVLFIHGRDGFWTPETDEALIKENYAALAHMSEENISLRRGFLGLN